MAIYMRINLINNGIFSRPMEYSSTCVICIVNKMTFWEETLLLVAQCGKAIACEDFFKCFRGLFFFWQISVIHGLSWMLELKMPLI